MTYNNNNNNKTKYLFLKNNQDKKYKRYWMNNIIHIFTEYMYDLTSLHTM